MVARLRSADGLITSFSHRCICFWRRRAPLATLWLVQLWTTIPSAT